MSVEYFEEQRREMIAAIRAITDHVAAEIGKPALDDRSPHGDGQGATP